MNDVNTPVAPGADTADLPQQIAVTLSRETDRELYAAARQAVATERDVDPESISRPEVFRAVARAYVGFDYEESGLVADGGQVQSDSEPTNPETAILDATVEHEADDLCGAPVGTVIESVLDNPTVSLADAAMALRDLRVTGEVYQPSPTTLARTSQEGSQ
jgi:hypothetical protein